jgi:peptidoglycan hydrolase CwlO-like protein
MTKKMIRIHDVETGEVVDREMTTDEINQLEADRFEFQSMTEKIEARKAAKDSAIAKLAALGLTEDEAKAVMG